MTKQSESIFGDVIHSFGRAQAIEDGVLVDVTATAKEAGFRLPVAMTAATWRDCVEWTEQDTARQIYQDEAGRLWDVLWMAMLAARASRGAELLFTLHRVPRGGRAHRPKRTILKMIIGGGDDGEPVITILFPSED